MQFSNFLSFAVVEKKPLLGGLMSYSQYRKTSYRQRSNADDLSGLEQVPEGKFLLRTAHKIFPDKNLSDLINKQWSVFVVNNLL